MFQDIITYLYRILLIFVIYNVYIVRREIFMDQFVRNRITQLRIKKGISEYQMSYDLGHSRGYINNISSGKSLPSLTEFFSICDYFEITPVEFFDQQQQNPELVNKALSKFKLLNDSDMILVLSLLNRLCEENA